MMTAVLASPTLSQKAPTYDPGEFWDEMFEAPGVVRPHYRALAERLATLGETEVTTRQHAAELSFQSRGVTFAVNRQHARPVGSTAPVQAREAHVTEWADGMVVRVTVYSDVDEGRTATRRLAASRP